MKKNIVIIILSIIIAIESIYIIVSTVSNNLTATKKEDVSKYTASEVIEYLKNQGYEFENSEYTYIYTTKYTYVSNKNNKIRFQKITNNIIGISYSWQNGDINDKWPEITSTYKNTSDEEKKQYQEYEKWLEYEGLTTSQITEALDYYDKYCD